MFSPVLDTVEGIARATVGELKLYGPAALEDDVNMASCIREGGTWTAVANDSREAARARLRAPMRR